jgi:hypothetical protein
MTLVRPNGDPRKKIGVHESSLYPLEVAVDTTAIAANPPRGRRQVADKMRDAKFELTKRNSHCNMQFFRNGSPGWRPSESRKGARIMEKANKNNGRTIDPVARLLQFVAQMLPEGCPPAARTLPARCPQVADRLR